VIDGAARTIETMQGTANDGTWSGIVLFLVMFLLALGGSIWVLPRVLTWLVGPRWLKAFFAVLVFSAFYFVEFYVLSMVLLLGFVSIAGHFDQVFAMVFFALKLSALVVGVPAALCALIGLVAAVRLAPRPAAHAEDVGYTDADLLDLLSDDEPPPADEP